MGTGYSHSSRKNSRDSQQAKWMQFIGKEGQGPTIYLDPEFATEKPQFLEPLLGRIVIIEWQEPLAEQASRQEIYVEA